MPISSSDALRIHGAIHGGKASIKLGSGAKLDVKKKSDGVRFVKVPLHGADPDVTAMEQNKAKASRWAQRAMDGSKITWFLGASPWGRIVDGRIESHGATIGGSVSQSSSAKVAKRPASTNAGPKKHVIKKILKLKDSTYGATETKGDFVWFARARNPDMVRAGRRGREAEIAKMVSGYRKQIKNGDEWEMIPGPAMAKLDTGKKEIWLLQDFLPPHHPNTCRRSSKYEITSRAGKVVTAELKGTQEGYIGTTIAGSAVITLQRFPAKRQPIDGGGVQWKPVAQAGVKFSSTTYSPTSYDVALRKEQKK